MSWPAASTNHEASISYHPITLKFFIAIFGRKFRNKESATWALNHQSQLETLRTERLEKRKKLAKASGTNNNAGMSLEKTKTHKARLAPAVFTRRSPHFAVKDFNNISH